MTVDVPHRAGEAATSLPYPLIFATVSGAHLYGFASVDAFARDVPRLRAELEAARDASRLPEHPDPAAVDALHDLVVRARLG